VVKRIITEQFQSKTEQFGQKKVRPQAGPPQFFELIARWQSGLTTALYLLTASSLSHYEASLDTRGAIQPRCCRAWPYPYEGVLEQNKDTEQNRIKQYKAEYFILFYFALPNFVLLPMILSITARQMAANSKQNQASRLAYLRETLGFTVRQVGDAVGRSSSRVTDWESDANIKIKRDVLEKLARLYKVTPDFILYGDAGAPSELREMEKAVKASRAPASGGTGLYLMLPFIGPSAYGTFSINCQDLQAEEFEECPILRIPGMDYTNAYVLGIRGNSMAPRYPDRSRHVVRPVSSGNWQYAQGVHAISLRSAMFLIKRITSNKDGVLTLTSDNGGSEMTIDLGDILCMWKVGEAAYMPAED
jgi:transcriptional regulator with XRE-family HTH domain